MNTIQIGSWDALGKDASSVRTTVFVEEQGIPIAMEWDDADKVCVHAVIYNHQNIALATGRLLPTETDKGIKTSQIGRMAVLQNARGQGLGAQVLQALMKVAQSRGDVSIDLHAQQSAVNFYLKQGYSPRGEPYEEVGIPHLDMVFQF